MVDPCGLFEIALDCEMTNNATMSVEITIGLIAATVLSVIFYKRQETQRKKIDGVITNQENLRKKRINYVVADLSVYLYSAKVYLNRVIKTRNEKKSSDKQLHEAVSESIFSKIDLENASRTIENSYDILEPELLKRIRNVIRAGLFYSELGFFPDTDEGDGSYDFDANWSKDIDGIINDLDEII